MIRVGIIGCGGLGRTHAEQIDTLDGIETVAFCDLIEERAQEYRDEFTGEYATTDPERIFSDERIDAVYVCTLHDTHAEYAIRALRRDQHVLVEKPLALTVEDCAKVYEAAEASEAILMTAFKMRYYELVRRTRELIPEPLVVTMQMMDDRWPDDMWANDPEQGGGNVISQGVHSTDVMRFVAGADPVSVSARGDNYYQEKSIIDNMAAIYQFENGAVGNLVQGDAKRPSHVSKFFLQAFDENAAATLTDRFTKLIYETDDEREVIHAEESGFLEENRAFRDAIDAGDPAPIDHVDGFLATLMILRGFDAIEEERPQTIDLPV